LHADRLSGTASPNGKTIGDYDRLCVRSIKPASVADCVPIVWNEFGAALERVPYGQRVCLALTDRANHPQAIELPGSKILLIAVKL